MRKAKKFQWILAIAYIGFVLWLTIFGRMPGSERAFKALFWEIQMGYWKDIVLNILLFIPLGFLIGGRLGIIAGVLLSLGIEFIQHVFCYGMCEVDDFLNNTIGVCIGCIGQLFVCKTYGYFQKETQK